ncbi:TraU family protein [Aliivibrio fischeri]|uniref:TraU family protein n=1 Tax=Aliivibrio fischeri TaxID=668 RepID=UPI0007C5BFE1|nr:TraU family protein [Aliivibrio fischeri]
MKKIKNIFLIIGCFLTFSVSANNGSNASTTSGESSLPMAELTSASLQVGCVKWKPVGGCVWLTCTIFGCSTSTSVKVNNWNPDIAIQVMSDTKQASLGYTSATSEIFSEVGSYIMGLFGVPIGPNGLESTSTGSTRSASTGSSSNLAYYDTVVVGNPALLQYEAAFSAAFGSVGWCSSPAVPLNIYYDSLMDAYEWRVGLTEAFFATLNTFEVVGSPKLDVHGNVYPRIGFTTQISPYKTATTLAYRAAHIVAQAPVPHVTMNTLSPFSNTNHSWPRLPMTNYSVNWTNVKPVTQNGICLPTASEAGLTATELIHHSETENYLRLMWSNYTCCNRRGSQLIANWG